MRTNEEKLQDPQNGCCILFIVLVILFIIGTSTKGCAQTQKAVYDTVYVSNSNIVKYVSITQKSGKEKIYAVYKDKEVEELIPVSATVYDYVTLCKKEGLHPQLAIRFRNGEISSLIRVKSKLKKK